MHTICLPSHHWVCSGSVSSPLTNLHKNATSTKHNHLMKMFNELLSEVEENNKKKTALPWERQVNLTSTGLDLRHMVVWPFIFTQRGWYIILQAKYHLQTRLCTSSLSTNQTLQCNSVIKNRSMTASLGSIGTYACMRWCMTTGINGPLFKKNRQKVRLREN